MFYVKERISDSMEVSVEINDENVFCICPSCGCEVNVDLSEVFADGKGDLYSTSIYCSECSKKIKTDCD
ncbi:hypothetical protein ACER0A_004690 [Haloimpatiens sp. FM7315]|uniref:hypothetical protein n=1 Tax=Haloimpatiens sp. FM7315 TaxID=3298609 RepID=UPI0035A355CA